MQTRPTYKMNKNGKNISSDESNNVKIWLREQKGYYAYTYDMIAL